MSTRLDNATTNEDVLHALAGDNEEVVNLTRNYVDTLFIGGMQENAFGMMWIMDELGIYENDLLRLYELAELDARKITILLAYLWKVVDDKNRALRIIREEEEFDFDFEEMAAELEKLDEEEE